MVPSITEDVGTRKQVVILSKLLSSFIRAKEPGEFYRVDDIHDFQVIIPFLQIQPVQTDPKFRFQF